MLFYNLEFCHDTFIYQILTKYNVIIYINMEGGEKNMEILMIGIIAGAAIAAGISPFQGISPKLF